MTWGECNVRLLEDALVVVDMRRSGVVEVSVVRRGGSVCRACVRPGLVLCMPSEVSPVLSHFAGFHPGSCEPKSGHSEIVSDLGLVEAWFL